MKIVAEISGNHGGYRDKACELIEVAAKCGCDYAKFQYYHPRGMYDYENEALYTRLAIPREWLSTLFDAANDCSIGLFASVFSADGVKDLLAYAPPYFKLASPQSTWLPTIIYKEIVAAVPADTAIIYSANGGDRERMLNIIQPHENLSLLCPPGHPPVVTDDDLYDFRFNDYNGVSDHSPGLRLPLAFAAAGATMIEKHLKLDDNCVDAAFSANSHTMAALCELLK